MTKARRNVASIYLREGVNGYEQCVSLKKVFQ